MPQTHLIRNCPKGSDCDQTWVSLQKDKHRSGIRTCLKCKKEVWEVTAYPISPYLLEHNCIVAIDYEITNLKKWLMVLVNQLEDHAYQTSVMSKRH